MFRIMGVVVVFLLCCLPGLSQAQTTYTLVPLEGQPFAIDPLGQRAAGTSLTLPEAMILTEAGPVTLGTLPGGKQARGQGICGPYLTGDSGVGASGATHAFLWTEGTGFVDLGTATGNPNDLSVGWDVNCGGTVVGTGDFEGWLVPLVWDENGVHILETFEPGGIAFANALTEAKDIVGDAPVGGNTHCVFWEAPDWTIHDCHADPAGEGLSFGFDINASRHIVLTAFLPSLRGSRAFLRKPSGVIRVLEPLAGLTQSIVLGINNSGLAVGASFSDGQSAADPGVSQATLWQDAPEDLLPQPVALASLVTNGAGWELRRALDASEAGVILGTGTLNGVPTAFFAIPMRMVAQPPPVEEPPVADARAPRHHRLAQHRDLDLHAWLARCQQHREVCLSKQARWDERVAEWKARHGEQ
jgi:hypothetical protein